MDWDEPPEPPLCAGNRRLSGGGREKAHSCREKQRQDEWCAHKRHRQLTALVLMFS